MKFLKQTLHLAEADDLSVLPANTMKDIQSNIRKGAQDTTQKWANALELVHKAYSVAQVQRPTPNMVGGWKQYDENIQFAVTQLSKARGIDGDWRMSSASLHEAMSHREFDVEFFMPDVKGKTKVAAPDMNSAIDVVSGLARKHAPNHKVVSADRGTSAKLTFWKHGIRQEGWMIIITP